MVLIDNPLRARIASMRRGGAFAVWLLAQVLVATPLGAGARAAELPAAIQAILPAARQEGEVDIYGRTVAPAQAREYSARISAFYGFPIKLNMMGGVHTDRSAQLALMIRNGIQPDTDVFWTSSDTAIELEENKAVQPVDWASLGANPALTVDDYGLATHSVSLAYVSYNTNLVRSSEAPTKWEDLLDPKWKGKIVAVRQPAAFIFVARALGEQRAFDLLDGLIKNDLTLVTTFADARARILSGEFAIGIGTDVFPDIRKGAPVRMAKMNPMPIGNWASYIVSGARHPNLAKLWAYWVTTSDGQDAFAKVDQIGFVNTQGTPLYDLVQGVAVMEVSRAFVVENRLRLTKIFAQKLGIR